LNPLSQEDTEILKLIKYITVVRTLSENDQATSKLVYLSDSEAGKLAFAENSQNAQLHELVTIALPSQPPPLIDFCV
jgi:hypothetical protein